MIISIGNNYFSTRSLNKNELPNIKIYVLGSAYKIDKTKELKICKLIMIIRKGGGRL